MSVKYCIFYSSLVHILSVSHMYIVCFTRRFYPFCKLMDYRIISAYNFILTCKMTSFLCNIALDVEFWVKLATHVHSYEFGRVRYEAGKFSCINLIISEVYFYIISLVQVDPATTPTLWIVSQCSRRDFTKEVTWKKLSEEILGRVEEFQN